MKKKFTLKSIMKSVFITSALICVLLTSSSCGMLRFVQDSMRDTISSTKDELSSFNTEDRYGFEELLSIISKRYIGDADTDELVLEAKRAIVEALDDEWSFYMSPEEFKQYMESSDNEYQGIGVEVLYNEEHGGIEVENIYPNSGAQLAGIMIGDIITAVDGESLRDLTFFEIRNVLRRPLGETATLTVLRSDGQYHELLVEYNVIFTDPVSYEMLEDNIGYVLIRNFEAESAVRFVNAVSNLIAQGATRFIYDVRFNNGGRAVEVTRILDFLLPECDVFIAVDYNGNESITRSDADFIDLPAVVLVNEHSYSGAEYFAAVLSEYDYAVTVGQQTTGKNRMQNTFPLSDGGALHVSVGMYLTPNRVSLYDSGGYTPDHIVTLTEDEMNLYYRGELAHEDDPQMQKALELIG